MARQKRWEAGNIHYPSLIKEGDRYRLWYCCFADPEDPWVQAGHVPGKVPGLWCYAESGDGFHWERPELGGSNTRVLRRTISSLSATKWVRPTGT